jgi:tetratricopeptide (TPR) repeat protein
MSDIQLDTLEAKGLIKLATIRPDLEYLFRHALVQDAAYGSLLKQERRDLHGRVAEALEDLYPDRKDELAPVLAMHFEQAGETDKAIDYLIAGGRHAMDANAVQEAFAAYDRALALADQAAAGAGPDTEDAETRRRRVEIAVGRARAGYSFLAMSESLRALEAVVDDAAAVGDPELEFRLHMLIAMGRLQSGEPADTPAVQRSLDRIRQIAERIGNPSLAALPLALIGMSEVFAGPVKQGLAKLEQAIPAFTGRDTIGAAFARGALAMGYAQVGDFERADAAVASAKEQAANGDLIAQLDAQIAESMVLAAEGRLDSAVPVAEDCVNRAQETGASACVLASSWVLGDVFHRQGKYTEAADILRRGADVALAVDRKIWRPTLVAWLGTTMAALGDVAGPDDWDDPLATAREMRNYVGEAGILGKRAESKVARGDIEGAIADFTEAARLFEVQGMRPAQARVLRELGETNRSAGRQADADAALRRSLALFVELKLDDEAREVRTEIAVGDRRLAFD